MPYIKEAVVETIEEIDNAIKHNPQRIELCSRLDVGGLTPSVELTNYCLSKNIETVIMMRNRPDFFTSFFSTLRLICSIKKFNRTNIKGYVMGVINRDNTIDIKTMAKLIKAAQGKDVIFHMAFDLIENKEQAISQLVALGVKRILTKGGSNKAVNNIEQLKNIRKLAAGRIEIIVGGGVDDDN
jgi:copper homeostasis protein